MVDNKGNAGIKILIAVLVILVIALGVVFGMKVINDKKEETSNAVAEIKEEPKPVPEEPKEEPIHIFEGTDRPIAVMIDNVGDARPQVGLNDAYVVYEIIVEGGYSRLMPIFKGQDLEKIGPVRSARHYFLDYALENDAIYAHFGWSPQAQSDIDTLDVDNINGLIASSSQFWRVKDKAAPHNAVTSTEKILEIADKYDYRTTSTASSVLNYISVSKENKLDRKDAIDATAISIPYSRVYKVNYEYNDETGLYERYEDGKLHTDWDSGEVVATKNIIITFAENSVLNDGENKDRQDLDNIGDLDGYYITNGKAIEIVCSKESRQAKTVYKDLNGKVIDVNDGNTFIQICPIDSEVVIE